jgi:hypothetical protein
LAYLAGGSIQATIILDADHQNATVTPTDVPGMAFNAMPNSVYVIGLLGSFTSSATTVGIGLLFVAPAGATVQGQCYHLGSTAQTMTVAEQMASGSLTNAGTIGVRAAAQEIPVQGWWRVLIGATGGLVKLQLKAEVAGTVVLKASSAMIVCAA